MKMQTKQYFTVSGLRVEIERKPWKVVTATGQQGGIRMTAAVYSSKGFGVFGESICSPLDEFNFRTGAKLALEDALGCWSNTLGRIVNKSIRQAIWNEFNRLLPPK
jgi:hypothetical protein